MRKSKGDKSQLKLAGKIGTAPQNLSDVKFGRAHFGAARARKAAKVLGTDTLIWLNGASEKDVKLRLQAVDSYLGQSRV
jgi:transcriptional regulator with XRE-family HTH domain